MLQHFSSVHPRFDFEESSLKFPTFYIHFMQSMPILRAFCFFAGTGVIFLYIFACSYFVACLVLDERRRYILSTKEIREQIKFISRASQLAARPGWKPSAWTRSAPCHKAFQKVTTRFLSCLLTFAKGVSHPSVHPCLSPGHYHCLGPCCRGWLW